MLMPMATIVATKLEIQTSLLQGMVVLPRCTLRPVLGNTQAIKLRRPISGSHCTVSESQPVPMQCNGYHSDCSGPYHCKYFFPALVSLVSLTGPQLIFTCT